MSKIIMITKFYSIFANKIHPSDEGIGKKLNLLFTDDGVIMKALK